MAFDWHGAAITRDVFVDEGYTNSQNVRRFLVLECGADFKFDRDFMAWIRNSTRKTMGDVADEWLRRRQAG